jgi:hypothetical protein
MNNDLRASEARALRLRAEELRAVADQVQNPMTRDSFLRMAENYERLARGYEEGATPAPGKKPQIG